ncbi:UNVERIFIED_CONTAM: hypothetical protein FKN15_018968 [Acipenser sinensis]
MLLKISIKAPPFLLVQPPLIKLCALSLSWHPKKLPFLLAALNTLNLSMILQCNFFFYKDWPIDKPLKALFKKGLPIEAGSDRVALFISYCNSISAKPVFPPQKSQQRSKLVSLRSAAAVKGSLPSDSATTLFSISSDPSSNLRYQTFYDLRQLIHPLSIAISTVSDRLDALDSRITRLEPAAITSSSVAPATAALVSPAASAMPTPTRNRI